MSINVSPMELISILVDCCLGCITNEIRAVGISDIISRPLISIYIDGPDEDTMDCVDDILITFESMIDSNAFDSKVISGNEPVARYIFPDRLVFLRYNVLSVIT